MRALFDARFPPVPPHAVIGKPNKGLCESWRKIRLCSTHRPAIQIPQGLRPANLSAASPTCSGAHLQPHAGTSPYGDCAQRPIAKAASAKKCIPMPATPKHHESAHSAPAHSLRALGPPGSGSSASPKPRVLLVSHSYTAAENQLNLDHLSKHCDLLSVVPEMKSDAELHPDRSSGLPERAGLVGKRALPYLGSKRFISPFGAELRRHAPDLVNVEYDPWSPLTLETIALTRWHAPGAKLVCSVKKNTYLEKTRPKEWVKRSLHHWAAERVDGYIAASESVRDLYIQRFGIQAERIHTCHHLAVDLEQFQPDPNAYSPVATPVIGFVGEWHERKGLIELVHAAQLLADKGLNFELRLLGTGPLRHWLKMRAQNRPWLNLAEPVPHREVSGFLRKCQIFAFPSRALPDHQEHDAHALMEAMACGLPSVVTESGIISELVGADCSIASSMEDHQELANGLETLILDDLLRRKLGQAARARALSSFGLESVAARRAAIYRRILSS